ncbi:hypothetical protein AL755_08515 [Arthrobacter sp. ERGS1:01]|uniref:hypothetical protein n=1 Tax=Arthrobacter sp. ERGS1:01 TaxID=1704044 RepID=UPI0006B4877B|nr:hypothetical protein [Arthrobacter sp. ERGS1:01]ALE05512.1 hypothetical protein AL755_08515 [Arthrobacter sp. ERGS1:01]
MLGLAGGETVLHRAYVGVVRDSHGNAIAQYAAAVPIPGVGVDVPDAQEPRDGASQRQTTDAVLFFPPGFNCGRRDLFTIRGEEYGVEGNAPPISNFFTGTLFRTEVKVRRVDG